MNIADINNPLLLNVEAVGSNINPVANMNLYVFVNIVIVLVNIGFFIYQRYDSSKLRRLALKDDFWFRTIALPIVLEPLKNFSLDQTQQLRRLKTDKPLDMGAHEIYLDQFQSKIYDLMDMCFVMHIHSVSLYEDLIKQLEIVEDKIAEYCQNLGDTNVNPPSVFTSTQAEIISIIMKFHDKNEFV